MTGSNTRAELLAAAQRGEDPVPHVQPDPQQMTALRAYSRLHGPLWRGNLGQAWRNGTEERELPGHGHTLRQIRNRFGPCWLWAFRFPEERKPA